VLGRTGRTLFGGERIEIAYNGRCMRAADVRPCARSSRRLVEALFLAAIGAAACTGELAGPSGAQPPDTSSGGSSGGTPSASSTTASASVARRLSRSELDNTLRDVLGDATQPALKFLDEDEYRPFDNDYTVQRASAALINALEALAEEVSARAVAPANRDALVPCSPSGPADAACFRQTIETVGQRLFRRPLTEQEIEAYLGLQAFATEDNPLVPHDFYTAVELMLRSMLQDPEFLYRIEIGTPTSEAGIFALDSYEIATRLSYLLWASAPDGELLSQASAGALSEPASRRAQAERLLGDARAREQLRRFHAMWLGYRAIPHPPELVADFNLETTKLIERVVFDEPQSYLNLFLSPETYLTDALASHYSLPAPSGGEGWVRYDDPQRAGILSHGSVLAGFSKFSDTSPTQRGIFVQTRLLCNVILPPPANVNVDEPPGGDDLVCKYDRYAAHRATPSCATCHSLIDPIGFGLEAYDIGGRFRTADNGHPECPIEGVGELPGYGTFQGPADLGRKLVESQVLEQCVVKQFYSYAVGRELRAEEDGAVAELTSSFQRTNYALSELLLDYVTSERFALRQEDVPQ
jgi:hypothetical protein